METGTAKPVPSLLPIPPTIVFSQLAAREDSRNRKANNSQGDKSAFRINLHARVRAQIDVLRSQHAFYLARSYKVSHSDGRVLDRMRMWAAARGREPRRFSNSWRSVLACADSQHRIRMLLDARAGRPL